MLAGLAAFTAKSRSLFALLGERLFKIAGDVKRIL
jgi:ATP-dependent protease HslVU (ClpYQ) peptidase subunit